MFNVTKNLVPSIDNDNEDYSNFLVKATLKYKISKKGCKCKIKN